MEKYNEIIIDDKYLTSEGEYCRTRDFLEIKTNDPKVKRILKEKIRKRASSPIKYIEFKNKERSTATKGSYYVNNVTGNTFTLEK